MDAPGEPADLLDLKLLPAWVKEVPDQNRYAHFEGESDRDRPRRRDHRTGRQDREKKNRERDRRPRGPKNRQDRDKPRPRPQDRESRPAISAQDREKDFATKFSARFLPQPPAFENVVTQIKSGSVAYSLFALARMFLEKPARYIVQLSAAEGSQLFQLGEDGPVAARAEILENIAFANAKEQFYKIETTQSEPIKGNYTNVARDRLSGTLLGPTNHHNYQPQLRNLYEQRFSRRMSFAEFQKQIEIVSDPAVVERWKEEARNITTFTTKDVDPALSFTNAAEAERHFRKNYLPGLIRSAPEVMISGTMSRRLPDRSLHRLIENAWTRETRSPSNIMPELAKQFRQAGLHIFRHRRGMLFVTPIRPRPFGHEEPNVSPHVKAILDAVTATPGINRKDLADKIILDPSTSLRTSLSAEEAEARKLALASDLLWLVSAGYVIEFNDGSLDLPRVKAKEAEQKIDEIQRRESETTEEGSAPVSGAVSDVSSDTIPMGGA